MKKYLTLCYSLVAASLLNLAQPVGATEVVFNGSMTGTSTGVVAPSCAPLVRQSTLTGTGASSLGLFGYTHTVCLSGIGPIRGNFLFDFLGGNLLQGSVEGAAVAGASAGLSNISLVYNILGGSGNFQGATGSFFGTGVVDQRNLPTTSVSINFAAVPEPGTWAMMLVGFGAIGFVMRRRRSALRPVTGRTISAA